MAACSIVLVAALGIACNRSHAEPHAEDRGTAQTAPSSSPSSGAAAGQGSGPRFVPVAPSGDLAAAVAQAVAGASAAHRTLVVYVGATWCEPCQRFHHAIEQGELSNVAELSHVTFLEADLDRDRERLEAAGYRSKYIPLFALPGPDGRSSGKQVEGGIKGDGAVAYMVPRLTSLLSL